ncbi:MAG TPA: UDP-3-O-acyl-N-acetylglucosamine deacetylase [Polyangiaceae bacterium]
MSREVRLEGVGLHTGERARVVLGACPGAVTLSSRGVSARIDQLEVAATARATTVQARGGGLRLGTVEHLFAALAGLGVVEGVEIAVEGPELPLLDGGAGAWCAALAELRVPSGSPRLRVTREAVLDVGPSRYELVPGADVDVAVRVELDDARLAADARWRGDPRDFVARIAPARTFALARDIDELVRRGLARHVDPACVVVLARDAIHHAGRPFSPDEPARHKLLDLLGDLYLHGGPPLGRVRASRPGHAANARALRRALDEGILAPL